VTINCRSLEKKKHELAAIMNYIKPDVICGTESWLRKDIQPSEVFSEGYVAYRKDRCSLAGGVFLLIHKSLVSSMQPDLDADCEYLGPCSPSAQQKSPHRMLLHAPPQ
jgi:hypothetical protein